MFDVLTTGDTAHIDMIFKFLLYMSASIFFTAAMIRALNQRGHMAMVGWIHLRTFHEMHVAQ